jgi:hypothetical protein
MVSERATALPTVLRIASIGCIAAAPFVPTLDVESDERSVVYVVDRSPSVGAGGVAVAEQFVREAREGSGAAQTGVVAFGALPEVILPVAPAAADDYAEVGEPFDAPGSDIAAGLRLGVAALPPSGERRVVLLTDGRPTGGDLTPRSSPSGRPSRG